MFQMKVPKNTFVPKHDDSDLKLIPDECGHHESDINPKALLYHSDSDQKT